MREREKMKQEESREKVTDPLFCEGFYEMGMKEIGDLSK